MHKEMEDDLWRFFGKRRGTMEMGKFSHSTLIEWLAPAEGYKASLERLEAFTAYTSRSALGGISENLPTLDVARFMARLGATFEPNRVFDPCCGTGLMLSYLLEEKEGLEIKAVDIDQEVAQVAMSVLGDRVEVSCEDAMITLEGESYYDLILSEPPLDLELSRTGSASRVEGCRTLDEALFMKGARCLAPNGHIVLLVSIRTLNIRGRQFWEELRRVNLYPNAFFYLKPGSLKSSHIASYIVVAGREENQQVFSAAFTSDPKTQGTQIQNLLKQREGISIDQGRWVAWENYIGHISLEASYLLEKLAPRKGLKPVPVLQAMTEQQVFSGKCIKEHDSSHDLYLTLVGAPKAYRTLPDLSPNLRILGLDVHPDHVDPDYLVELLNGDVGQLIFQSMAVSSGLSKLLITNGRFRDGTLYLPDIKTQRKLMGALKRVRGIEAEAHSIEEALLDNCRDIDEHIERMGKLNQEQRPESWYETLPFPLGSILWRYHIAQDDRERYDHLLHFFEALAEFMALVHLSAAQQDKDFWLEHTSRLRDKITKQGFNVSRATFGLWKLILEYISAKARKMYNENSEGVERVRNMYATRDDRILHMLFASEIKSAIQAGNSFRNNTHHGGVLSEPERKKQLNLLEQELQKVRECVRETWGRYQLILPGQMSYRAGVYHYENAHLGQGTRAPFATCSFQSAQPLEEGKLYLKDQDALEGLPLLPLVRFGSPPANAPPEACYFYNRLEGDQIRMVSYHHDNQPEVTGEDLALMELLNQFSKGV